MGFKGKKIGVSNTYSNFTDFFSRKPNFTLGFFVKIIVFIFALGMMVYFSSYAFEFGKKVVTLASSMSIKVVSHSFGEEMQKDELGQINVLIAGFGGENHQGGYLSDTMMIASYNPKLGTVTFLSVPRDLYVKYTSGGYGRINAVLPNAYGVSQNLDSAAQVLGKKLSQITGVPINYYAMIDFQGFRDLVDSLGGIDVDVPYDLVDTQYPINEKDYGTFKVSKGVQHFDGETALRYARSRHSTSDFSRALRQQQIIKAVMDKVLQGGNLTNIDKIKNLYAQYNNMVHTNISLKEMIGLGKYLDQPKTFFSFVYSSDCNLANYKLTDAGCFLYYAPRAWFGGASVVLPSGATPENLENYKKMQDFAFFVVYNQKFLLENARIKILDGIGTGTKKKTSKTSTTAQQLAITLKKYGFNVIETGKSPSVYEKTTAYLNSTGDLSSTVDLLKIFMNVPSVINGTGEDVSNDITLILGNDFAGSKF